VVFFFFPRGGVFCPPPRLGLPRVGRDAPTGCYRAQVGNDTNSGLEFCTPNAGFSNQHARSEPFTSHPFLLSVTLPPGGDPGFYLKNTKPPPPLPGLFYGPPGLNPQPVFVFFPPPPPLPRFFGTVDFELSPTPRTNQDPPHPQPLSFASL